MLHLKLRCRVICVAKESLGLCSSRAADSIPPPSAVLPAAPLAPLCRLALLCPRAGFACPGLGHSPCVCSQSAESSPAPTGPFIKLGPLRNVAGYAEKAGCLSAAGLVAILTACLAIYGAATFQQDTPQLGVKTLSGEALQGLGCRCRLQSAPVHVSLLQRSIDGPVVHHTRGQAAYKVSHLPPEPVRRRPQCCALLSGC